MTGRVLRNKSSWLVGVVALAAAAIVSCGPDTYEIPIETPIKPKLDVTPFQRVLVAGFVAGGSEDVDTNQETVRLLRSQLRNKSTLKVIDADVMPLIDIAQDQSKAAATPLVIAPLPDEGTTTGGTGAEAADRSGSQPLPLPQKIKEEKDLEPY